MGAIAVWFKQNIFLTLSLGLFALVVGAVGLKKVVMDFKRREITVPAFSEDDTLWRKTPEGKVRVFKMMCYEDKSPSQRLRYSVYCQDGDFHCLPDGQSKAAFAFSYILLPERGKDSGWRREVSLEPNSKVFKVQLEQARWGTLSPHVAKDTPAKPEWHTVEETLLQELSYETWNGEMARVTYPTFVEVKSER